MNVTLSIDEATVARARAIAEAQGTSLNQVIREFLMQYGASGPSRTVGQRLTELLEQGAVGDSGGGRFSREELYAERLDRYRKP
ncbi:MAG: ribbon-helix-helix protein, CopG family [Deltaproteobacteria bacterium]|nr:ribbon-helix-helix protein, CopG family [Deltaproteobacteria bacterium]